MQSTRPLHTPDGPITRSRARQRAAKALCLSVSLYLGLLVSLPPASARQSLGDFYPSNNGYHDRACPPRPQMLDTSGQAGNVFTDPQIQMPAVLAVLNYELATAAWPNLSSGYLLPGLGGSQPGQVGGLPSTADVQKAIQAILNDPALTLNYTGAQSVLTDGAGGEVVDDHTIVLNQQGLYAQGAPLSFYAIAQHIIHELGYVFEQRNWTTAHLFASTPAQKEALPLQLANALLPDNFAPDQIARTARYLNNARSIAGTWGSTFGNVTFQHAPITGNQPVTVTGFWLQDNDPGMVGRIDGGVFDPVTQKLDFSYTQEWDGSTGTATFTLSCAGEYMPGFCQGVWNLYRNLNWDQQ